MTDVPPKDFESYHKYINKMKKLKVQLDKEFGGPASLKFNPMQPSSVKLVKWKNIYKKEEIYNSKDKPSSSYPATPVYIPHPTPVFYDDTPPAMMKGKDKMASVTTQKAKGVVACADTSLYALGVYPPSNISVIPSKIRAYNVVFPCFARPCPVTPRHGFIDSRKVESWEQALDLYQKVIAEEGRDGELILMPQFSGKHSAVAVGNNVTWGYGHDGVTNGSDHSLVIPTPGTNEGWKKFWDSECSGHKDFVTDHTYVELVEHEGKSHIVQLRDGPIPPATGEKDIIPHGIEKVANIYSPDHYHDLLDWEKLIKRANVETDIVWAPGVPMSSHHLVHALLADMVIITDHTTSVSVGGEIKMPEASAKKKKVGLDVNYIKKMMNEELLHSSMPTKSGLSSYACLSIATIQSQMVWESKPHLNKLRGVAPIRLLRMALAACIGELRHMQTGRTTPIPDVDRTYDRNSIYSWMLRYGSLEMALELFPSIVKDFRHDEDLGLVSSDHCGDRDCGDCGPRPSRGLAWRSNFGGKAWGRVSAQAYKLAKAIDKFRTTPTETSWKAIVGAANNFINMSHNNGKVLTKWIDSSAMTHITRAPSTGFMNYATAKTIFNKEQPYGSGAFPQHCQRLPS